MGAMESGGQQGMTTQERRGLCAGLLCYVLWGLFPLYWNLLADVNPFEVIAHRFIWCFATTAMVCAVAHLGLRKLLRTPRAWRYLVPAALVIAFNWSVYIWAVTNGHVVESAIGYYINPLVSILLGVVAFGERLTRLQVVATALCCVGVVFFTVSYGQFPWIAISLAVSFGVYGAIKKRAGYPATVSLAFENTVMLVPAVAFACVLAAMTGEHAFASDLGSAHGILTTALLVLGGPVTAVPLILFAKACVSIPLSLLGFIQYVSPTIALVSGVFFFGEPFTVAHAVCLGCIWCGLALVGYETIRAARSRA